MDSAKEGLQGHTQKEDPYYQLIQDLTIPLASERSIIVRALQRNEIYDSFGHLIEDEPAILSIADQQILRLFETDGMVCLPMMANGDQVGVIVFGINRTGFDSLERQVKLLQMFVHHAAMSIQVDSTKRRQTQIVQNERLDASSFITRRVAHEVNNPLGIITNYIKIMGLKLPEKHPVQGELKVIDEEVNRITGLIGQLSNYAKEQQHKYEAININTLYGTLLPLIDQSILAPAKIQVHFRPDPELPIIKTNKDGLKQVLINLVKNAAEALAEGGNISIATQYSKPPDNPFAEPPIESHGHAKIIIQDDGPGLPDEIKARLFEPFNSTKDGGHSGLGLSIVHSIIKDLRGTITCHSNAESGTTFEINLPVAPPSKE